MDNNFRILPTCERKVFDSIRAHFAMSPNYSVKKEQALMLAEEIFDDGDLEFPREISVDEFWDLFSGRYYRDGHYYRNNGAMIN